MLHVQRVWQIACTIDLQTRLGTDRLPMWDETKVKEVMRLLFHG